MTNMNGYQMCDVNKYDLKVKTRDYCKGNRKRRRSTSPRKCSRDSGSYRGYDRSYRSKRDKRSRSPSEMDSDGHLKYRMGDTIGGKYEITENLGEGTFGKVVKCFKRGHKSAVAVKIVKGIDRYTDAAKIEVKILEKLKDHDPYDESGCIHMIDWFEHSHHVCIVFKLLGLSVYEHMKQNEYRPFNVSAVRAISYQLLRATRFMHDMKLTHTDLKPENMLFNFKLRSQPCGGQEADISLIDFGSATFESEHHSGTVSTRHYRAPEVILEHEWSYACDLWSIGCIMFELLTGVTMFQTHSNFEHLCMMQHILGPLPKSLLEGSKKSKYFNTSALVNLDWGSSQGEYIRANCKPLRMHQIAYNTELEQVFNLIEGLLKYSPRDRLSSSQALRHPFFDEYILNRRSTSSC